MRTAFTLIELIFIIIVVAIIGVTAMTTFKKDTLAPATIQVLDHIRYTQQLALNQDMFTPSQDFSSYSNANQLEKDSRQWFKKWWQIQFHQNDDDYTIYSDYPTDTANDRFNNVPVYSVTGNGDIIATDPQTKLFIAGGSANIPVDQVLDLVDLDEEFGVEISMKGCGTSRHILFDNIGRPHCSKSENDASLNPYDKIASSDITVCIYNSDSSNVIHVVPITGFASISWDENCP